MLNQVEEVRHNSYRLYILSFHIQFRMAVLVFTKIQMRPACAMQIHIWNLIPLLFMVEQTVIQNITALVSLTVVTTGEIILFIDG